MVTSFSNNNDTVFPIDFTDELLTCENKSGCPQAVMGGRTWNLKATSAKQEPNQDGLSKHRLMGQG